VKIRGGLETGGLARGSQTRRDYFDKNGETGPARKKCCQSVATLLPKMLPVKWLAIKRVTDVATFLHLCIYS
jgi:hypothetical protein